jgi:tetratricopeptide (TPR) repeat protein
VVASTGSGTALKQEIRRRIDILEAAIRKAEANHAADVELGNAYRQLALLYEDAAEWGRSEATLEHAISLLRHSAESSKDLATAVSQLGSLHVAIGRLRDSEREELEALKLREKLDDRLQIARSWSDLAALSLAQHKFEKARDYAQKAVTEFVANEQAGVVDRITARYTLALAFCYLKENASAIPLLKAAIDDARAKLEMNDFPIGLGDFLLGYAYWKSGDLSDAGPHMQRGMAGMSAQLGWGHPAYVSALKQYAKFLHESKNLEAASIVDRQIRQAEAVVDVHSIQAGQGAFGFAGLR